MESSHLPITELCNRDRLISELVHLPLHPKSKQLMQAVIELGNGPIYIGNLSDIGVRVQYGNAWVTDWSQRTVKTGLLKYTRLGNSMQWEIDAHAVFNRSMSPVPSAGDATQQHPRDVFAHASRDIAAPPPASLFCDLREQACRVVRGMYEVVAAIVCMVQLMLQASITRVAASKPEATPHVSVVTLTGGQKAWDFGEVARNEHAASMQPPLYEPPATPASEEIRKNRNRIQNSNDADVVREQMRKLINSHMKASHLKDHRAVENLRLVIISELGKELHGLNLESDHGISVFHGWAKHCTGKKVNSPMALFISGLRGDTHNDIQKRLWHKRVTDEQRASGDEHARKMEHGPRLPRVGGGRQLDDYQVKEMAKADFKKKMGIYS
jgi:hypothetical protein